LRVLKVVSLAMRAAGVALLPAVREAASAASADRRYSAEPPSRRKLHCTSII
jgi:hypothetical protein